MRDIIGKGIGFILTMWYVNCYMCIYIVLRITRFILTMWYVNPILTVTVFITVLGFILTMWYVNVTIQAANAR